MLERLKPVLVQAYRDLVEQKARSAQRMREATAAAAREATDRAAEQARRDAAREARRQEIRLMEGSTAYEAAKTKAAAAHWDSVSVSEDSAAAYLDLVRPAASSAVLSSRPPDGLYGQSPSPPPTVQKAARYFSENGAPLRPLLIPASLVATFLELATPNTRRSIETCGVIAGRLSRDQFTLTHLIVPKQEGTADTCAMVAEEEILEVQDRLDLLTLGWIHTHPTQACFLSSVDLHTHFPYQLMMAEAVAIVVAPTQSPNFGVFRLTDPPGLGIIAECPARGFHPHSNDQGDIYRAISGPTSHAQFSPSLALQVIDLRR